MDEIPRLRFVLYLRRTLRSWLVREKRRCVSKMGCRLSSALQNQQIRLGFFVYILMRIATYVNKVTPRPSSRDPRNHAVGLGGTFLTTTVREEVCRFFLKKIETHAEKPYTSWPFQTVSSHFLNLNSRPCYESIRCHVPPPIVYPHWERVCQRSVYHRAAWRRRG